MRLWNLVLLSLIVVNSAGCRALPETEWLQLQSLRQALLKLDTEFFRPEQFRAFDKVFTELKVEARVESNRFFHFRSLDPLRRKLRNHVALARQLIKETSRARDDLRKEQEQYFRLVRRELDQSPFRLNPRFRDLFQRMEFLLAQAIGSCNREDYRQTSRIHAELEKVFNDLRTETASLQQRFKDPLLLDLWTKWGRETIRWSADTGSVALIIEKQPPRALLYRNGRLFRKYQIDLGWNGLRDKIQQGDGATPEGRYWTSEKKDAGKTKYHRALLLNYPNEEDTSAFEEAQKRRKLSSRAKIGGLIEVHGEGGKGKNWTDGCIALNNRDMKELFEIAYVGMPITVIGKME